MNGSLRGGWCVQSMRQVEIRPFGIAAGSAQVGRDLDSNLDGHITPKTCGGMT